jgi:anti-anti-sigma regulatory factor
MNTAKTDLFVKNSLKLEIAEDAASIRIKLFGRSIDREPGNFITPIITDSLKKTIDKSKSLVIDFRELTYMNSSTITPFIKLLDRAQRGNINLTILYNGLKKWQDLNFSALKIFETGDQRVMIKGS